MLETFLTVNNSNGNGDLIVTRTLVLENHTQVDVTNGKAYFNNISSKPNTSSLTVKGDTYIYGSLANLDSKTPVCVQGTLYSKEDLSRNREG